MNEQPTDPATQEAPVAEMAPAEQPVEQDPAPVPETQPEPEMQKAVAVTIPAARSELVRPQPPRPAPVERWIKIEKAQLATIAQVFDGHTYAEFALEDVVCITQGKDDHGTGISVSLTGASVWFSNMSPLDADELLKKWRAVRAAQRRG